MTTHRFARHGASAGALAILAAAGAALPIQSGGFVVGDNRLIAYGQLGFPPPSFGRTVIGQMTGDLRADGVVMSGNHPVFLYGPGLYSAAAKLPETANDIAVLPGAAPEGLDGIVTTSDRGLELWWPDGTPQQFAHTSLGSAAWQQATRVLTADLDASGTIDVIGLCSDQRTLRVLLNPMGTWSELALTLPSTVHDFVLLDWDGGPSLEVAALTSPGVKVLRLGGAMAATFSVGVQGDLLAVLPGSGAAYDRLAGLLRVSGSSQQSLYVTDKNGAEAGLVLGSIDASGAAVGDLDLDGLPDLIVSQKATHELLCFTNQGAGVPTFSLASPALKLIDTGPGSLPAPGNFATPALADLDLDGDLDILFPVQSSEAIAVLPNRAIAAADRTPRISGRVYQYDEELEQGTLILRVEQPLIPLAGADAFELTVWLQESITAKTRAEAELHFVQTLGTWPQELTFEVPESIQALSVRNIEVRLVDTDGNGTPLAAGPSSVGAFSTHATILSAMAESVGLPWESVVYITLTGYTYPSGQQSDISAGVVPMPDVPDFDEDVVPDPDPTP